MLDFSPIDFRADLNDEQFAAVTAPPGPALVLAGAGSGKTRTLTYRVAYLMLEKRVSPHNILLLTFTNKAAKEMVNRVMELTGSVYPPQWGGTFHSLGGRLLRQFGKRVGLEPNFNIMDQGDAESLLASVVKEIEPGFTKNKDNPKPGVIHNLISFSINTDTALEALVRERFPFQESLPGSIEKFARRYRERKLKEQVADYDDLLYFWRKLLQEDEDARHYMQEKFQYILVDEYQDTNILQSAIIDQIGSHHNVMAVGDDAQCIYTWRGANFENIRSFPERHPDTKIYTILRNYRSSPEILDLANAVLANQAQGSGYAKELVPHRPSNGLPCVIPLLDGVQQAQFVANRIQELYHSGVSLSSIAILYRAHYQAIDMQMEFSKTGIPFIITSGMRFFDQAHIRDFVAQLRVVNNPADSSAFERILALLPRVGPATVSKILKAAQKAHETMGKRAASATLDIFATEPANAPRPSFFQALLDESVLSKVPTDGQEDFQQLAQTLIELDGLMKSSESAPSAAELVRCAIMGWYGDFIRTAYTNGDERRDDLEGLATFAERFETLNEFLAQVVLLNSETSDRQVDPDEDAVRMTTVHQAKGLEFPVVFVLGCAEDFFPLRRAIEAGDVEEERRLFYVAVTRAMEELYICFPMVNSGRGQAMRLEPSRFLQDLPRSTYEKLQYRTPRRW